MSFVANPFLVARAEGRASIRPEDIKAYGVERYLREQEARGPLLLAELHFTEEENRLMDQILAEEKQAKRDAA